MSLGRRDLGIGITLMDTRQEMGSHIFLGFSTGSKHDKENAAIRIRFVIRKKFGEIHSTCLTILTSSKNKKNVHVRNITCVLYRYIYDYLCVRAYIHMYVCVCVTRRLKHDPASIKLGLLGPPLARR